MYFKMEKKADISLSFGVIFSIIIIAAVIAVGFYAINHFLNLKDCTDIGLFQRDLQAVVDDVWNSDSARRTFSASLPGSIDKICVGDLALGASSDEYKDLRNYRDEGANLFFYPVPSCDIKNSYIEHVKIEGFNCIEVKNGKATLVVTKGGSDALATLCDPSDNRC